jgi:hypothetical protein
LSAQRVGAQVTFMRETIQIKDVDSFREWKSELAFRLLPRKEQLVEFQLPEFSREQNRTFSALLNEYQKACGCTTGGLTMSLAVVTSAFSYFLFGGRLSDIGIREIGSFLLITIAAAVFGKVLGLVWARWKLMRLVASIQDSIIMSDLRHRRIDLIGG